MRRGMEGGGRLEGGDAGGRRFSLDRSKFRVLLCDKDPKSSQEVLRLLNNCSYQDIGGSGIARSGGSEKPGVRLGHARQASDRRLGGSDELAAGPSRGGGDWLESAGVRARGKTSGLQAASASDAGIGTGDSTVRSEMEECSASLAAGVGSSRFDVGAGGWRLIGECRGKEVGVWSEDRREPRVTTVRTARQVIDLLTNGNEIDIVLCEVDLPIAEGLKMLKCIARKKDLRRIPIIMMSSRDEVSVVVRCLRLGAADYLVKPLRTNELLNLWTHSWRRRHMLGQAEKDIFNQSIGMIFSDHSDANTNSTTFLSEDTDDKIRTRHQEVTLLDQKDHEFDESHAESDQNILSEEDNALQHANHPVCSGKIFSWPTKMDLKVGQSSAFISYVKSRAPTSNSRFSHVDRDATPSDLLNGEENLLVGGNIDGRNCWDVQESHSLENSIPSSEDVCNRSMLQAPKELPVIVRHTSPNKHLLPRTEGQIDVLGMQPMFHAPFYLHGQPSSMQGFQGTLYDLHMQNQASLIHQYNVLPQSHHSPMMQHFAYHPVAISLPSGHRPLTHLYSSSTSSHMPQSTNGLAERRAAALMKFKQKKKERCYDKKIRYINRKRLAEKRPRVRGQFVRQVNDVDIQLNDSPAMNDYDSDEEEDEPLSRELELDSSPEHDTY
ncbi:hypothetical protein IEQ34_001830 [Dendrobium chrysotoxum]|uniref:Two-component response regulator-like APRR1 n=1 Tax=Dendrobium chrysotoxum TaxID=161865 RepID=A0AAV7HPB7_DENCH|nr:hypothetical protein IEQ34_001830 [Dendrobium chrysotoxum]